MGRGGGGRGALGMRVDATEVCLDARDRVQLAVLNKLGRLNCRLRCDVQLGYPNQLSCANEMCLLLVLLLVWLLVGLLVSMLLCVYDIA